VLQHARLFLSRVMPDIGEETPSYLNIHWKSANPSYDPSKKEGPGNYKNFWSGRACNNLDDAIRNINFAMGGRTKDIYVCMSLQSKREEVTSQRGNIYYKSVRFAEHAVALKSIFIDVDVKADGGYPDTQTALNALQQFIADAALPMPTCLVASGSGGFHVHWVMDRALKPAEWQRLADKMAVATQQHGLLTDSQCTIDIARILRIPDTINLKGDPPFPVELMSMGDDIPLEVMAAALEPYVAAPHAPAKSSAPSPNDDLGANLDTKRLEPKVQEVAAHCPFIARTLGTGGEANPNPLWFLTAVAACFMEDGRAALHSMSSGHSGYSPPETDALFDRTVTTQQARNTGWPACAKFSQYGAPECKGCPLLVQGKSPLNFAAPLPSATAAPPPVEDTLPERFTRSPAGIIMFGTVDENGQLTQIPICNYPILNGWLSNNPWTFHFTTRTEQGRKTIIEIPTDVITQKEGIAKYLGGRGFFCTDPQYKALKEFFVAWLQKLQASKDSVISAAPFGWSVVDGKVEGFTFGGRVWMGSTDRPAANPNPGLSYQYTPKGGIAPWVELSRIIWGQQRPGLDAILAVAFAGPLVRFTGFPGLILNAYSAESGIGKTTAMKVSQAVWGHPVRAMQGLSDTSNSVLNKMGQINSLPVYWDEIKSEAQTKRFCSIVFDLTGGREKTRLNADSTLKMSGTWQTMMVSASNDSLVDGMAREVGSTTAGLHRLFEYVVDKPLEVSQDIGVVQRLTGRLEDNYGLAGLIYAKFLGAHWARVEAEVAALQDTLYAETAAPQEERMWIATITVVLKGAEYANELGLTQINVPLLREFLMQVLTSMRAEVQKSPSDLNNDMSVSTVLAEFLNSTRSRNTLNTSRVWVVRGKPPKGSVEVLGDTRMLGEIMVQIGRDDRLIRFSSTAFTKWMGERSYSRHTFMKKMESEFGLKLVNGKLGSGTEFSSAMEYLIELDMNHPKLSKFVE
jgi:hypothetical protein